jgi:hypothetical protein
MYKREGPRMRFGRWLTCGTSRLEQDNCPHCGAPPPDIKGHVFIDRLPAGGFTGYALLSPFGQKLLPLTGQQMQLIEQGGIEGEGEQGDEAIEAED